MHYYVKVTFFSISFRE